MHDYKSLRVAVIVPLWLTHRHTEIHELTALSGYTISSAI